jgi:hypothetical protein
MDPYLYLSVCTAFRGHNSAIGPLSEYPDQSGKRNTSIGSRNYTHLNVDLLSRSHNTVNHITFTNLDPYEACDQIVSFIHEEWTPIYTFQFARHFAHATALLVRSREIRTNEVQGITHFQTDSTVDRLQKTYYWLSLKSDTALSSLNVCLVLDILKLDNYTMHLSL